MPTAHAAHTLPSALPPLSPNQGVPPLPGDNTRANATSQKWLRPGMPPDLGGVLRGCPLLGGAI